MIHTSWACSCVHICSPPPTHARMRALMTIGEVYQRLKMLGFFWCMKFCHCVKIMSIFYKTEGSFISFIGWYLNLKFDSLNSCWYQLNIADFHFWWNDLEQQLHRLNAATLKFTISMQIDLVHHCRGIEWLYQIGVCWMEQDCFLSPFPVLFYQVWRRTESEDSLRDFLLQLFILPNLFQYVIFQFERLI